MESSSKHRKHKKKHKHKHLEKNEDKEEEINVCSSPPSAKPVIKLKFKIGSHTLAEKRLPAINDISKQSSDWSKDNSLHITSTPDSGEEDELTVGDRVSSDEEQEWLEALESGDLDDDGMLRRARDPNLMTARQRALVHGASEVDLQQLPSGYKSPELTQEQLMRRQQKADKRRQLALEKREKDKKLTMERLLKKQEAKLRVAKTKGNFKTSKPHFRYINNMTGITLSVPQNYDIPITSTIAPVIRDAVLCSIDGCHNIKRYSCSKTGRPLCSLECYKQNLNIHRLELKVID